MRDILDCKAAERLADRVKAKAPGATVDELTRMLMSECAALHIPISYREAEGFIEAAFAVSYSYSDDPEFKLWL